jgi:hypothetical protein
MWRCSAHVSGEPFELIEPHLSLLFRNQEEQILALLRLKEVNLDIRSELIEARKAVTGEPVLRRLPAAH